jgi:hypothetical protein
MVVVTTFVIILGALGIQKSYGMETELQLKYGVSKVRDHGDMQGNNSMFGIGVSFKGGDKIYWEVSPELWKSNSYDFESTNNGYSLLSKIGYRFHYGELEIIPVIGPYIGRWERGGNAKFPNSWTYVNYVNANYGVDLNYKWFYGKFEFLQPVYYNSNGRSYTIQEPRENLEVGIRIDNWSVGIFGRTFPFEKIDNNIFMQGILVGYKF